MWVLVFKCELKKLKSKLFTYKFTGEEKYIKISRGVQEESTDVTEINTSSKATTTETAKVNVEAIRLPDIAQRLVPVNRISSH
jgi:hypothetical protein